MKFHISNEGILNIEAETQPEQAQLHYLFGITMRVCPTGIDKVTISEGGTLIHNLRIKLNTQEN